MPRPLKRIGALFEFSRRQLSMPSSYQGSPALYVIGKAGYYLRQTFKRAQRRTFGQRTAYASDEQSAYRQAIETLNWDAALRNALEISTHAERKSDAAMMLEMSKALLRLGAYERSAQLALAARRIRHGKNDKEWTGQDISGRVLLIDLLEDRKQGLGGIIRYLPFAAPALRRAGRGVMLTEPRLAPILKRSFPAADIRAGDGNNEAAHAGADAFATFEHLACVFGDDADKMEKNFTPLKADEALKRRFRADYRKPGSPPLVGLSWGSKSYDKDVPDLREWSRFVADMPAQFVSLQYGRVPADLPLLTGGNPGKMIHDLSVDQMKDMDRFAAQICALDAVVSISNTVAHFAGALGVPAIFVIDDKFHTPWPVSGGRVPWYPRAEAVQKRGRDWPAVLDEVRNRLGAILEKRREPAS